MTEVLPVSLKDYLEIHNRGPETYHFVECVTENASDFDKLMQMLANEAPEGTEVIVNYQPVNAALCMRNRSRTKRAA